jgi:hypothetical protein
MCGMERETPMSHLLLCHPIQHKKPFRLCLIRARAWWPTQSKLLEEWIWKNLVTIDPYQDLYLYSR